MINIRKIQIKKTMHYLTFFSLVFLLLNISSNASAFTGGCNDEKIYQPKDIFYFKLQIQPGWGIAKPWAYSAEYGGMQSCKKFMNKSEAAIMSNMATSSSAGQVGWGDLRKAVVTKKEFCKAKHFSAYGLGAKALKYCNNISLSKEGKKALLESGGQSDEVPDSQAAAGYYTLTDIPDDSDTVRLDNKSLCLKATTIDGNEWIQNEYKTELIDRGFNLYKCRGLTERSSDSSSSESTYSDNVSNSSSNSSSVSVKDKLKELKILLDDGLITEKQYEEKSSKILEEF